MPDAVARPGGATGRRGIAELALGAAAVIAGLGIAALDTRPSWDDTGITVGLLLGAAAAAAAASGRRPWLWATLVGAPLPIVEIAGGGATASLLALVFAAAGASIGWLARRGIERSVDTRPGA